MESEFTKRLSLEFPDHNVVGLCEQLMRLAKKYSRLSVTDQYRPLSTNEQAEMKTTKQHILALCNNFPTPLVPTFGDKLYSDDFTVKLWLPWTTDELGRKSQTTIGIPGS